MIAGIVLPTIALGAAGVIELGFVLGDKSKLQAAADAAALSGAAKITLSTEAAVSQAQAHAELLTTKVLDHADELIISPTIVDAPGGGPGGVKVAIYSRRPSFFGSMFPPGGFVTNVSATAMSMMGAPLCVFGVSAVAVDGVDITSGTLTAAGCVVHSNHSVNVGGGSTVTASLVQAAGTVKGPAPNPRDGAETIDDPFADVVTAPPSWSTCKTTDAKADGGADKTLAPGVHCGHIDIDEGSVLMLSPGVHYFRDRMQLKKNAMIEGKFATMVFGPKFDLQLEDNGLKGSDKIDVRWNLYGTQSGPLAGFVIVVDRARTEAIKLPARMVRRLEGVVYAPTAPLVIYGEPEDGGAEDSAWTVLIGREIRLVEKASVTLQTDYANSAVPVPSGVGNKASAGGQRLSK